MYLVDTFVPQIHIVALVVAAPVFVVAVKTFNVQENYLIFQHIDTDAYTHTQRQRERGRVGRRERQSRLLPANWRCSLVLPLSLSLMMMMIVCFLATLFSFLRVVAAAVHIFVVRFKLIICLCIECRALILAILFHIARVCKSVCVLYM